METILFKRFGGPIKFRFIVKTGKLGVLYNFELCKRKCKKPLLIYEGDNYHKNEDFHYLPSPICDNNNRILKLNAEYTAFKTDKDKNFLLSFEVVQGRETIKQIERMGHFSNKNELIELEFELEMVE